MTKDKEKQTHFRRDVECLYPKEILPMIDKQILSQNVHQYPIKSCEKLRHDSICLVSNGQRHDFHEDLLTIPYNGCDEKSPTAVKNHSNKVFTARKK